MQIINNEPNTPASVLGLFTTAKQSIAYFASSIINEVEEGRLDPLKVLTLCKAMEATSEKIIAGIKANVLNEASKYGEKPFMFNGCELHKTATKTDYDYESSNDKVLERLLSLEENIKRQVSNRKEMLKTLTEPINLIDEATGEVFEAKPPVKKQVLGVKVSIK